MIPKKQDILSKEKIKLYNNFATINDCEGRLLVEFQIYPTPRIIWEFEKLGTLNCNFPFGDFTKPLNEFNGYAFSIEKPYLRGACDGLGPRYELNGSTAQAVYADADKLAHHFEFYLPNTKFQQENLCQAKLQKTVTEATTGKRVSGGGEGRYIDVPVDDTWSIRLEVRSNALDWLNPQNQNIGTLVTTVGRLYQTNFRFTKPETFSDLQTICLKDALKRLEYLSYLLSYANGGFIGPLYVESYQFSQDSSNPFQIISAIATVYQVTPLERLGLSWNTSESDLTQYVKCLSTFERMMDNQVWKDTFSFSLIQYFQAIQNRDWSVLASAIGAVLERLSYTILVEEEADINKKATLELLFNTKQTSKAKQHWNLGNKAGQEDISVTKKRLRLLLERIGLTNQRGYNDLDDVFSFIEVRNDAVHPRVGNMTAEQRGMYINQAIQWVDEILLWRLGYNGKYLDRTQYFKSSTSPRYDLGTRNPSW